MLIIFLSVTIVCYSENVAYIVHYIFTCVFKFSFHACYFLCLQYFRRESDPIAQKSHVSPLMTLQMFLYNLHKVINQGILHHAMDLRFFYFVIEMYLVLSVWKIISSHCMKSTHSDLESAGACSFPRFIWRTNTVLNQYSWFSCEYVPYT